MVHADGLTTSVARPYSIYPSDSLYIIVLIRYSEKKTKTLKLGRKEFNGLSPLLQELACHPWGTKSSL